MSDNVQKLYNLVQYHKAITQASYGGQAFDGGYHSIRIAEQEIAKGQRDCAKRLQNIPLNFDSKVLLDLGCNQGGILFELQNKLKYGIGLDYAPSLINICNKQTNIMKINNLAFYVFNLESESPDIINNFIPYNHVDIISLLSVCIWISNWKQIIKWCALRAPYLLFEITGDTYQQQEQLEYCTTKYNNSRLISAHSHDDLTCQNRKLYLCSNN